MTPGNIRHGGQGVPEAVTPFQVSTPERNQSFSHASPSERGTHGASAVGDRVHGNAGTVRRRVLPPTGVTSSDDDTATRIARFSGGLPFAPDPFVSHSAASATASSSTVHTDEEHNSIAAFAKRLPIQPAAAAAARITAPLDASASAQGMLSAQSIPLPVPSQASKPPGASSNTQMAAAAPATTPASVPASNDTNNCALPSTTTASADEFLEDPSATTVIPEVGQSTTPASADEFRELTSASTVGPAVAEEGSAAIAVGEAMDGTAAATGPVASVPRLSVLPKPKVASKGPRPTGK